ncbi:YjeF domain-containing protein [Punctularia strigosozonata HHB-11173 SS5]|uniref:ATP-dependent (S)-NAD(P)H-hydrate dehydratase n=1 Tax=Punctularia strigosozonata (strain HHB-11173) TaxID=741275 RepID=R7S218_PUNST|nr:YjeF domain-containing protein [Punctularia strigosozonata HHB-11173 SS5]EIN03827.1 YjeF domain-containing protein [Punctularia strigosozonata HHB-11173 SS5]
MPVAPKMMAQLRSLIPPLNGMLHKGQSGRVGVLGGALDYTGAPYFASISSQRLGAELAHVICSPTAGGAIKSYSPDLIVHPILKEESSVDTVRSQLESILSRLHVLVLGPGLGREDYMQKFAKVALEVAKSQALYTVLDADGLYLIDRNLDIIKGYRRAVLTPNVMEFKRLSEAVKIDPSTPPEKRASLVSKALGGVLIVQKGPKDILAANTTGSEANAALSKVEEGEAVDEIVQIDVEGGLKRCGGQGDILSGTIGCFLAWGKCYEDGAYGDKSIPPSRIPILAAAGGCTVTRTASKRAFLREGRSVVTQDMLGEIGNAFAEVFGEELQGRDPARIQKL